jgi:phasin family protein
MTQNPQFPFDMSKFTDFFKSNDFSKHFQGLDFASFDPQALFAAQQKNMAAFVEANKSAASGYQELFQKQLSVFEEAIADAQAYVKSASANAMAPDAAKTHGEAVKAAFEKAMGNMAELAEGAQKANSETYKLVSERVASSVAELQALAAKFKA